MIQGLDLFLYGLIRVQYTGLYAAVLIFFAAYPIFMGLVWITTSLFYRIRWEPQGEQSPGLAQALGYLPLVSVLIPAHNEEDVIASTLDAVCALDYPTYEVVVVDDGSTDRTREIVMGFLNDHRVRLIAKEQNEGKAMAINDALSCLTGEIIAILDADAEPESQLLRHMTRHFASGRVGAVTGNPRVKNVDTMLARLQLMEFTSIVSLLRRSQRIWGRIVTVSGVVAAFRRSAIIDVGRFSPEMPTEDIELTWKLQRRFWDVRYEPLAVTWMTVPDTFRGLVRQRLRWARGLMQVLRKHRAVIVTWKTRRMWLIYLESLASIAWSLCFFVLTVIWLLSWSLGYPPVGASPIPNLWGMTIATLCMIQLLVGAVMDRRYDPLILRYYPYAVFYPIIYWTLMALCTVVAVPQLFRSPAREPIRWRSTRETG